MRAAIAVTLIAVLTMTCTHAEEVDHNSELKGKAVQCKGLTFFFAADGCSIQEWIARGGHYIMYDVLILSSASGPNELVYATNKIGGVYEDWFKFKWENGVWKLYMWMPSVAGLPGYWRCHGTCTVT